MKMLITIATLIVCTPVNASENKTREIFLAWNQCERAAHLEFRSAELAEAARRAHYDCMLYQRGYNVNFERCPWEEWIGTMPNWWCWKEIGQ
jgi:hypothetical protein